MRSEYFSRNVLAENINDKKCKKHGGFPTEVSDMVRYMKMELLTFSLILYQPAMKNPDALGIFSPECFGGKYKPLKKHNSRRIIS
jgi:hypothetical protein